MCCLYISFGIIATISFLFCIEGVLGAICYTKEYTKADDTKQLKCVEHVLYDVIADSSMKMALSLVQCFSLIQVLNVSCRNNRRLREAYCPNITYSFIIVLQIILNISLIIMSSLMLE